MSARKILGIVCFTLILLLSITGTGFAQDPQPPTQPETQFVPPHASGKVPAGRDPSEKGDPAPAPAAPDLSSLALTLGTAGLNFSYAQTFGVSESPYLPDTTHLNHPWSVATVGTNVLIGEQLGHRVLRYTNTNTFVSQVGTAGTSYNDGEPWEVYDMAVDASGQTWVVDNGGRKVVIFDSSNNYVREFKSGTFGQPAGIAFDDAGNVYISDGGAWWSNYVGNQRVLVYNSAGTLLSTIGTTGVSGSLNTQFFGPQHLAIYGSQLYVADSGNNRVQIFTISNPAAPVYYGTVGTGVKGNLNTQFNHPNGVAVDATYIYVADRYNDRVQVFTRSATPTYVATMGTGWGTGNDNFKDPCDVAIDTAGNIYVAEFGNYRVQQFNSSRVYQRTYGVTGVPYLTDNFHYNSPSGVAVATDGSMYISEDNGQRLIKRNANGTVAWTIGAAGVKFPDQNDANDHLQNPGDIDLDSAGKIYLADQYNGRIQIFNPDGTYSATLGAGTGNYEFSNPTGLKIDKNDFLYVADGGRQRVQIFNAQHIYVATLGETDVSGTTDNAHFNNPQGVAVDGNGNIYVADSDNFRVQVFNASRAYVRTLGVTGTGGEGFGFFENPQRLAVDSSNRLYVADQWNNRVQVFDATGAYLTTVGGRWGSQTSGLRNPRGLDIDQNGALYVADWENHRIQKYTPGTPGWKQSNLNGFGEIRNEIITSLGTFGSDLYAGTYNSDSNGAQLWRSSDGLSWTSVMSDGFGDTTNKGIDHLLEFNGKLYAGTWNETATTPFTSGGQIWRSDNGTAWERVVTTGFGDATNGDVMRLAVFNSQIYASTWVYGGTHGGEIWRSSTGDTGDWTRVVTNGLGDSSNTSAVTMEAFNGSLYAGTYGWNNSTKLADGCEVWRTTNGTDWTKVITNGFGNSSCYSVESLSAFGDSLYAGIGIASSAGGQVWRCSAASGCDAASDWTQVTANGFGNPANEIIESLRVYGGQLYAGTGNWVTGMEVWKTSDGATWQQAGFAGFGDSNNANGYYDHSTAVFNDRLFIGTSNWPNGGEVWALDRNAALPVGWAGGVTVTSDRSIVAVGRPHAGAEVMTYNGFGSGSTTSYVPMLFKNAWGSYNAALYIQNTDAVNSATVSIKYYDANGGLTCTAPDATVAPLAIQGYWIPDVTCLPNGWVGGAVITANRNIVAVGRPHIGSQVTSYDGFGSGSPDMNVPMLFKGAFGGSYNAALYVQNTDAVNTASFDIKYYDASGNLTCSITGESLSPLASKGYWVPDVACLPDGWVGGAVVSADKNIVAIGRPHVGEQVTSYNGIPAGQTSLRIPMLFKTAFGGSYNAALYIQNTDTLNSASITINYYDSAGNLTCAVPDTLPALATKGYWVPAESCLPEGWVGGAVITADKNIVAVGRPHVGAEVATYGGFSAGSTSLYLPMLFKNAWGTYDSAFYVQNTDDVNAASVTFKFFDTSGVLSCIVTDSIPKKATKGYWVPSLTCNP